MNDVKLIEEFCKTKDTIHLKNLSIQAIILFLYYAGKAELEESSVARTVRKYFSKYRNEYLYQTSNYIRTIPNNKYILRNGKCYFLSKPYYLYIFDLLNNINRLFKDKDLNFKYALIFSRNEIFNIIKIIYPLLFLKPLYIIKNNDTLGDVDYVISIGEFEKLSIDKYKKSLRKQYIVFPDVKECSKEKIDPKCVVKLDKKINQLRTFVILPVPENVKWYLPNQIYYKSTGISNEDKNFPGVYFPTAGITETGYEKSWIIKMESTKDTDWINKICKFYKCNDKNIKYHDYKNFFKSGFIFNNLLH